MIADYAKVHTALDKIQSTILLAHGRDNTYNIFLRFKNDEHSIQNIKEFINKDLLPVVSTVKGQLSSFTAGRTNQISEKNISTRNEIRLELESISNELGLKFFSSSAFDESLFEGMDNKVEQSEGTQKLLQRLLLLMKQYDDMNGKTVVNCFFSNRGLTHLSGDVATDLQDAPAFEAGMTSERTRVLLRDSQMEYWGTNYADKNAPIDMLILCAYDDSEIPIDKKFPNKVQQILDALNIISDSFETDDLGSFLVEEGKKIKNASGHSIEPFGYQDGINQPIFLDANGQVIEDRLHLVLHPEGNDNFGSFLVYRKLEQNIKKFEEELERIAKIVQPTSTPNSMPASDFIGAQAFGRYRKSGSAIVADLPISSTGRSREINKFEKIDQVDYTTDGSGLKCPFFSHIRRMNKKGREEQPIISRIGIPYEESVGPFTKKGLLFMCHQRSIEEGFEKLQIEANGAENDLDSKKSGDPIIGQETTGKPGKKQAWSKKWGTPNTLKVKMNKVVRLMGGEYFYTPSIPMLEQITQIDDKNPV